MKIFLSVVIALLASPVVYGGDKQLRYIDFEFKPNYETGPSNIKQALEQTLTEFHYIKKLSAAVVNKNFLVLYRVKLKKDRAKEFASRIAHKENVLKQRRDEDDRTSWDAVSYIDISGKVETLDKTTKDNDFFSIEGRRDYDYYGCVDHKPTFVATLIQGQPDFFFVITATQGSPVDPLVSDYMALSIYSSQGHLQLKEKIFWANYYPANEGAKVHYYGESSPELKFGEMPESDGYGRKRYAKLFIADLDNDNQLEILFWFKTFKSTEYNDKRGFRLEKESFKIYHENAARTGFEAPKIISINTALKLLDKKELTWEKGYPQGNMLCEEINVEMPMMMQIVN